MRTWMNTVAASVLLAAIVGSLAACGDDDMPSHIGGLPVEEDADISESLQEDGWRLVKVIQRADYPCDSLTSMYTLWKSYEVSCNNDSYTYEVGPVKGLRAEYVRVIN